MKIWIVFAKAKWEKNVVGRYIDSQWACEKSANERAAELSAVFTAFNCRSDEYGMSCHVIQGSVSDAKITE